MTPPLPAKSAGAHLRESCAACRATVDAFRRRLSYRVHCLANRIYPPIRRPLCPDCNVGPDVGDDCPICQERQHEAFIREQHYQQGYEDGYEVGRPI